MAEQAQSQERALRVGIFQGGRSLEERLFRRRSNITVGQSAKNTFVVPATVDLPKGFTLFEVTPKGYALNFTDRMEGRLSLGGDAVVDLAALRKDKAQRHGELWHLVLNDRSHGRIMIGDLKILFQFVQPPPVAPRMQLPASVKGSLLGQMDNQLALVLLGSFIVHFGFVIYLRTLDFPKGQDIEEIPDRFVQMLVKKVEPPKKEEETGKTEEKKDDAKKKDDGKKKESAVAKKEPKKEPSAEEKAAAEAKRRAELAAQVGQMGVLKMLTAKGQGGTLADLVKGGDPGSDADKVFGQIGGVNVAGASGLNAAKGAGGTGLSRGIDGLRASGPSEGVSTGEKGEGKVRGMVRDSAPQDLDSAELDPNAVAAKIRQYKGALIACYESALKRNPTLSGKITLRFTVNKVGKVSKAEIETDTMHDDDVNKCIIERASSWRFPPPKGQAEDVQFAYPFIFQASK